jgi:hypothetical protein
VQVDAGPTEQLDADLPRLGRLGDTLGLGDRFF